MSQYSTDAPPVEAPEIETLAVNGIEPPLAETEDPEKDPFAKPRKRSGGVYENQFKLTKPFIVPDPSKKRRESDEEDGFHINLPSEHTATLKDALDGAPIVDTSASEAGELWEEVTRDSMRFITQKRKGSDYHDFEEALNSQEADWQQGVTHAGKLYGSRRISINSKDTAGDYAALLAIAYIGGGRPFLVQLTNSCVWLAFKTPPEAAIVSLLEEIREDIVTIGRYTYGLAGSSILGITERKVVEFAFSYIYFSTINVREIGTAGLLDLLDQADINNIMWGILNTRFPDGLLHRRSCVASPGKCYHVSSGYLDLQGMQVIDNARLTDTHKAFMSNRGTNTLTVEAVEKMQKEVYSGFNNRFEVYSDTNVRVIFHMKRASLREKFQSTDEWLSDLTDNITVSVSEEDPGAARAAQMMVRGHATSMRQFSHFVEKIELDNGAVFTERKTINKILDGYSADTGVRLGFFEAIRKWTDSTYLSITGLDNYICPDCRKLQPDNLGNAFEAYLPFDTSRIFFSLLYKVLERINLR